MKLIYKQQQKKWSQGAEEYSGANHCSIVHLGGQVKFLIFDVHKTGRINSSPWTVRHQPVTFEIALSCDVENVTSLYFLPDGD